MNNMDEYQCQALRSARKHKSKRDCLLNAALGLGESGEVQNIIKKHTMQGHELDADAIIEELGDIMWYVAWMARLLDTDLSKVCELNISKLRERYPNGFSPEDSLSRKERK